MRLTRIRTFIIIAALGLVAAACAQPSAGPAEELARGDDPAAAEQVDTQSGGGEADHGDQAAASQTESTEDHGEGAEGAEDHDEGFWFGEGADPSEADRVIEVIADEFSFSPNPIQVRVGEVITFRVTNVGQVEHDFTIGDKETQLKHEEEMASPKAMEEEGEDHGDPNVITIPAGETREITFRFTAPGMLEIGCHVPGHYAAGMLVPLEVRA